MSFFITNEINLYTHRPVVITLLREWLTYDIQDIEYHYHFADYIDKIKNMPAIDFEKFQNKLFGFLWQGLTH